MRKNKYPLLFILGMKTLTLFQKRHHATKGKHNGSNDEGNNETHGDIAHNETNYGTAGGASGPIDVATLKTQKFKGTLKPLEYWIVSVDVIRLFHKQLFRKQTTKKYRRTVAEPGRPQSRRYKHRQAS